MTADRVSTADAKSISLETSPAGLLAGTIVLTLEGEQPVEALRSGMRIITRDRGAVALRAMERHEAETGFVQIKAGSLGHTRPERDVTLPADQPVLIRDWRAEAVFGAAQALVPAGRLVDGEFISDLGLQTHTLYQLHFDALHVIYADGLELGTLTTVQAGTKAA